jgi:hypothetical protein
VVVELCKSRSAALGQPLSVDAGADAPASSQRDRPPFEALSASASSSASEDEAPRPSGQVQLPRYVNPLNLASSSGPGGSAPGGAFLGAVSRSVSLGGQSALLLRVLLAWLAKRTAGAVAPGDGETSICETLPSESQQFKKKNDGAPCYSSGAGCHVQWGLPRRWLGGSWWWRVCGGAGRCGRGKGPRKGGTAEGKWVRFYRPCSRRPGYAGPVSAGASSCLRALVCRPRWLLLARAPLTHAWQRA